MAGTILTPIQKQILQMQIQWREYFIQKAKGLKSELI